MTGVLLEEGLDEKAVRLLFARVQLLNLGISVLQLKGAGITAEMFRTLTSEVERLEAEADQGKEGCLSCRHTTRISNACWRLCGHTDDPVVMARAWRIRSWRVRMGLPSDGHGVLTSRMVGCPGHEPGRGIRALLKDPNALDDYPDGTCCCIRGASRCLTVALDPTQETGVCCEEDDRAFEVEEARRARVPVVSRDPRIRHDADEVVVRLRTDIENFEARLAGLEGRRERLAETDRLTAEKVVQLDRERHGIEEQRGYARTLLQWLTAELW